MPKMKRASKGLRHTQTVPEDHHSLVKLGRHNEKCQADNTRMDKTQWVESIMEEFTTPDGGVCTRCGDMVEDIKLPCGHFFCSACLTSAWETNPQTLFQCLTCKNVCGKICEDKFLSADAQEDGSDKENGGGESAEALCPPSRIEEGKEEDEFSQSLMTELMGNEKRSGGLAGEAPTLLTLTEEQNKPRAAPVDEALPQARKRRRAAQDGHHTVKSLKEALRKYNALTTGNKDALMDRLEKCKAKEAQKERGRQGAPEDTGASEVVPKSDLENALTNQAALQEVAQKMMEPGLSAEDLATRVERHFKSTLDGAEKDMLMKITNRMLEREHKVRRAQGYQHARKTPDNYFKRYSWSDGLEVPAGYIDRIEIVKQMRILGACIFKLHDDDPRLKEGQARLDIMSKKLQQSRGQHQTCKEVDTVEDEVGANEAEAERFEARLNSALNGLKRHAQNVENLMTDYNSMLASWEATGAKTAGLAADRRL